jgi:TrmH family RNA methyltransferase
VAARERYPVLAERAARQQVAVHTVSGEVMAELAQTVTPQGVLAVCTFITVPLQRLTAARPDLVAVLAGVRDPGNAGTVLRTADAAGAGGVVFCDTSVDPYNGKCVGAVG